MPERTGRMKNRMGRIKQLDEITANGIAAGEVVERPASVVKELIENALDAGASVITTEIQDGGIRLIRVTDNGCGMDDEDAVAAFACHATSKLNVLEDLNSLSTMGFRGEALSSIASVSRITLKTIPVGEEYGSVIESDAGKIIRQARTTGVWGTTVEVKDLFYNFPARYKFLKKDQTEAQYITVIVERFSLVRPDVSFRLIKNNKEILHTPGNNDPKSALYSIYGGDVTSNCIPVESEHNQVKVRGFAGKPGLARAGRGEQTIFVNDRIIRSKIISAALDEAYKTLLMKGKFAFAILMIYVPSALIDVNVHPQKAEVRFWNDSEVFRAVYHAVHDALMSESLVEEMKPDNSKESSSISESFSPSPEVSVSNPSEPIQTTIRVTESLSPEWVKEDTPAYYGTPLPIVAQVAASETAGDSIKSRDRDMDEVINARYVGIVFSTYILLETPDSLILLDQHAAHEKVLYEKLLSEHISNANRPVASQALLSPHLLSLSVSDADFIESNRDRFIELGFDFDRIGARDIAIRYSPSIFENKGLSEAFLEIADYLKNGDDKQSEGLLLALATAACKAAVKAHDRLDSREVRALIDSLVRLDNPFTCPHGRPIILRYSRKNLEKDFKRIV